jgi:hypothetical protein
MKPTGAMYIDKSKIYVVTYGYVASEHSKRQLELEHVAFVKYAFDDRKTRTINLYFSKYPDLKVIKNNFKIQKTISRDEIRDINEKIDKKYGIIVQLKPGFLRLMDFVRKDINDFVRKPCKEKLEDGIYSVEKIVPEIILENKKERHLLQGGKSEYVNECILTANLDFLEKGCISSYLPNKGSDIKKTENAMLLVNYNLDSNSSCIYCYANYQNQASAKYIKVFDKEHLKRELLGDCYLNKGKIYGGKIDYLRLGKRTEAGSKLTQPQLKLTLETCLETGTKIIMPTKFLEFDGEIAKLLKETKSSVLFSIGWNELENGACSHDCTNEWRIEQALRYRDVGVNSIVYLLIDAPVVTERDKKILNDVKGKIPVQFLPIRLTNKESAYKITGGFWEDLQNPGSTGSLFSERCGGYQYEANTLVATRINDFFLGLVGDNKGDFRMCYHVHDKENEKKSNLAQNERLDVVYCGKCFAEGQKGIITKQISTPKIYKKRSHRLRNLL